MKERRRPGTRRARRLLGLLGLALIGPFVLSQLATGAVETVGVVNVNTASQEELQLLPGVGPVRARAILAERKKRGGFKRIEELAQVKGLGDSMLSRLRPHVVLSGLTTARQQERRRHNQPSQAGG